MPAIYIDILKTRAEIRELKAKSDDHRNIRETITWNNKTITIAGKSVYWKDWHVAGILKIKDILDDNSKFLSYCEFCRKTGLNMPFTKFFGLISAIPDKWRRALRPDSCIHNHQKTVLQDGELSCKCARKLLIQDEFKEPVANSRLHRLGVSDTAIISAIHRLPFKITRDTRLSMFRFEIIHNILPHGSWLQ